MKKKLRNILISSAMFTVSTISFGQTEKGNVIIGLNFEVGGSKASSSNDITPYKNTFFNQSAELSVGKFVKKDLMLGLALDNYNASTKLSPGSSSIRNNDFGIHAQLRQYLYQKNNLLFFVGGGAGIRLKKTVNENTNAEEDTRNRNASIFAELGANYFVSKKIALEGRIITTSTFMNLYGVGNGFSLGLKYFPENESYSPAEEIGNSHKNWLIGARFANSGNAVKNSPGTESSSSGNEVEINAGKFLGSKRNHLLALGLSLFTSKSGISPYENKSSEFMITPFYEYYFRTERLSPYIGLSSSFLLHSPNNNTFTSYQRLSLGLAYFLKDHFLIKANFAGLSTALQNSKGGDGSKWRYSAIDLSLFNASNISLAYRW
jgi:hypothetical protein